MCPAIFSRLLRWMVVVVALSALPVGGQDGSYGAAWAQDGDGGDDDGGDDGGEDGGTGDDDGTDDDDGVDDDGVDDDGVDDDGGTAGAAPGGGGRRRASGTAPVATPVALPQRAPDEIVVVDLSAEDLARLTARNYVLIETRTITELGIISYRLRVPRDTSVEAARDEVRALATGGTADFNHFYRTDEGEDPACTGPQCPAFALVGWPGPALARGCGAGARIGLIDTGINPAHETFADSRLELLSVAPSGLAPSRAQHGTAVAAILIGDPGSRAPGLVPQAEVIAVDAFHSVGGDERSDVFSLVDAMDRLATAGVDVINMSLSGPPNIVLEEMVARLQAQGIVIVAAAGNDGPQAEPVYPGAYAAVLTVTAVDAEGAVYRRAGRGAHVDLAAPGVEVWTAASVRGARGKTGTSFAAPFVTAAVAILMAEQPEMTVDEVTRRITATARDLGAPGRDDVFGAGLVQLGPLCSGVLNAGAVSE